MASASVKKTMINKQTTPTSSSLKDKVDNKPNLKRKIESLDTKNKTLPSKSSNFQDKGKSTAPSSSTPTKRAKREKKVYNLPGQKYDIPEEREPLRIFYESLSEQIPSSEMAEFWLMEHGMLSPERAKKAYEKKQRKQKQQKTGTPIKSPPSSSSNKQKSASKNGDIKRHERIR